MLGGEWGGYTLTIVSVSVQELYVTIRKSSQDFTSPPHVRTLSHTAHNAAHCERRTGMQYISSTAHKQCAYDLVHWLEYTLVYTVQLHMTTNSPSHLCAMLTIDTLYTWALFKRHSIPEDAAGYSYPPFTETACVQKNWSDFENPTKNQ